MGRLLRLQPQSQLNKHWNTRGKPRAQGAVMDRKYTGTDKGMSNGKHSKGHYGDTENKLNRKTKGTGTKTEGCKLTRHGLPLAHHSVRGRK